MDVREVLARTLLTKQGRELLTGSLRADGIEPARIHVCIDLMGDAGDVSLALMILKLLHKTKAVSPTAATMVAAKVAKLPSMPGVCGFTRHKQYHVNLLDRRWMTVTTMAGLVFDLEQPELGWHAAAVHPLELLSYNLGELVQRSLQELTEYSKRCQSAANQADHAKPEHPHP